MEICRGPKIPLTHVMFWNYIHDVTLLIMQIYDDGDDLMRCCNRDSKTQLLHYWVLVYILLLFLSNRSQLWVMFMPLLTYSGLLKGLQVAWLFWYYVRSCLHFHFHFAILPSLVPVGHNMQNLGKPADVILENSLN